MSEVSVHTRWVPGKMPPTYDMVFDSSDDEEVKREWRQHQVSALVHYPESTTLTMKDVTFPEIVEWMEAIAVWKPHNAQEAARDLLYHLLGEER